uniref:Uncharacterized protein n=1 Tax=Kalanchoe fedtschenkoi TaxID=63787 RepID=A0A7N0UK08_KALFE
MVSFNCFCVQPRKKKQIKGDDAFLEYKSGPKTIPVKLEDLPKPSKTDKTSSGIFVPYNVKAKHFSKVKVMNYKNPGGAKAPDVEYEGGDEQEEVSSVRRDFSDLDLQAKAQEAVKDGSKFNDSLIFENKPAEEMENEPENDMEFIQSGHVSDPGFKKAKLWGTPKLKRSCSNLETRNVLKKMGKQLPPSNSHSYENLHDIDERMRINHRDPGSPAMSHHSADRVILKKHSSSQILPSRSRKLWWKMFLWSHRNLHNNSWASLKPARPLAKNGAWNQQGGYCSDTLEPSRSTEASKVSSPRSFTADNEANDLSNNRKWKCHHVRGSGLWTPNQWVAFSTESSSLDRVDEWVNNLDNQPSDDDDAKGDDSSAINIPSSPENGRSPARSSAQLHWRPNHPEEMIHANSVIQSLNSSSTTAHIAGIGLKVIPTISPFTSLRTVNLSNNSIVRINPGSLPKSLHTLDLSRNKISVVESLKELTRLRVLDLSYNRISRIEHGLSNCQLIKELYLAGNKISYVEGLHRLSKLAVLDLSFNKITTTKAMGQLVANYNSLLALNLLGNPIQNNISEEQIRKSVCGLLPKLAYLNKQPIKAQRAREVLNDNVARAALGSNGRSSRRRTVKRVSPGGLLASNLHRSKERAGYGSRHSSRSRSHHPSPLHRSSSLAHPSR